MGIRPNNNSSRVINDCDDNCAANGCQHDCYLYPSIILQTTETRETAETIYENDTFDDEMISHDEIHEVSLGNESNHSAATGPAATTEDEPFFLSWRRYAHLFRVVQYCYSLGLLIFCIAIVTGLIFTNQTVGTKENEVPNFVAFGVFWFLLVWLGIMEGGLGCLIGLIPVDKNIYEESHPDTYKNCVLSQKESNMKRFIIGRQFLSFLAVFAINLMATPSEGALIFGIPNFLSSIFISNGVAIILVAIVVGQLTAQLVAAECMIDFINNKFMLVGVSYISYFIEASGLLHCVYLAEMIFSKLAGYKKEGEQTDDEHRSAVQKTLYWSKILASCIVLIFSFIVILSALLDGKTAAWDGLSPYVSIALFFFLMATVGILEGMQVALFAVVKMPLDTINDVAKSNCELAFDGDNLRSFLIGRQICVTLCMFIVARLTSIVLEEKDENVLGVSDGLQELFNSGILGAIITTIVASLIWRIIATSFPVAFLSLPFICAFINVCLFLEATGLCSAAWVLADLQKKVCTYKRDTTYMNILHDSSSKV